MFWIIGLPLLLVLKISFIFITYSIFCLNKLAETKSSFLLPLQSLGQ